MQIPGIPQLRLESGPGSSALPHRLAAGKNPCSLSWVLSLLWGERGYWAFVVVVLDSLHGDYVTKGVDAGASRGVGGKDPR